MSLATSIEYLFPGINFLTECRLQDDGAGPYIAKWNRQEPQPTQAELDAAALPAAKAEKRKSVTQERMRRESLGVPYTFTDGQGVIQTRDAIDYRNISGHTTGALLLQAQGVTEPVIPFRDAEDVTHMLTPAQMIALGAAVLNHGTALYMRMWQIKDSIDAVAPGVGDLAALEAIDITAGWPE